MARCRASTVTGKRAPGSCLKMFGNDLVGAFGAFKRLWDPTNKMNPGKVVDAFGPGSEPPQGTGLRAQAAKDAFRVSG